MLDHGERVRAARAAIDYITGRSQDEQRLPVPNCPGWTVYNAAAHIGRVAIAWEAMITAAPDDPQSRERGYRRSGQQPEGATLNDAEALDAATYTAQYFLPPMRRVTNRDPGRLGATLTGSGDVVGSVTIESDTPTSAAIEGPSTQVLLALWGRPHHDVHLVGGDQGVWAGWQALPSQAFQFGTWD